MNRILRLLIILLLTSYSGFAAAHSFEGVDGDPDSTKKKGGVDELILKDSLEALTKKIQISFKIKKSEQSADSIYFNVFTVVNTDTRPYTGNLVVRVPTDWNLIANPSFDNLTLNPGDSLTLPVRISIPVNATGGVAYVVDASFTCNEGIFSGVAYVKVPMKSKWEAEIFEKEVYFNELFNDVPFQLKLSNKGNSTELLKVKLKVGRLFQVVEADKDEFYIELPPYTDTVLQYTVTKNLALSLEEREQYSMIWDESAINVNVVGSNGQIFQDATRYVDLENHIINERQENNTPLNVELGVYNLLSPNPDFMNLATYGQLLFKGKQDLDYYFNFRNLYRNGTFLGQQFWNHPYNVRYHIGYNWNKKLHAEAGLITNYTMNSSRGIGVKAQYKIQENEIVRASVVRNQFLPINIYSAEYTRGIKGIMATVGLSYENNDFIHYNGFSVEMGASASLAKNHSLNGSLLLTNVRIDTNVNIDNIADLSKFGVSYRLNYNGHFSDKFRVSLNTRNDQFNYLMLRPVHMVSGNARYTINSNNFINVLGTYNSVHPNKYSNSPFYNGIYTETQYYRITYQHRFTSFLTAQAGPLSRLQNRSQFQDTLGQISDFENYFFGVYGNLRVRIDQKTFVAPNFTIGRTSFANRLTDTTTLHPILTSSVGVTLNGRNYKFNGSYIFGPVFFVDEQYAANDELSMETLSLRGQMEKMLKDNVLKVTGYATYYLRLPSNRQNFILSGRLDFYFSHGWRSYLTANVYSNSSVNAAVQDINTQRLFGLNAGVVKSFGFDQPRIKYSEVEFICFNDFNGDGERQENEPLLPNIKVKVMLNPNVDDPREIRWQERELITSVEGNCKLSNMPDMSYLINFDPLTNLGTLYNVNGDNQEHNINEDKTIYVPYAESYRVYGKILLHRDQFSSKGLINVGGIRVTATNIKGDVYSVLTDNDGNYLLNVPQAGSYVIEVNNIFGEEFYIDKEAFVIQFDGFKTYELDFTFFEGKRKVNFGGDNFFNFQSLNEGTNDEGSNNGSNENGSGDGAGNGAGTGEGNGDGSNESGSNNEINGDFMQNAQKLREEIEKISVENEKTIETPVNPDDVRYMVEIGVFDADVDTDIANLVLSLGFTPTAIKVEGVTVYATPVSKTHKEISDVLKKINEAGLSEAMIVGIYQGKIITEEKAREYRGE